MRLVICKNRNRSDTVFIIHQPPYFALIRNVCKGKSIMST